VAGLVCLLEGLVLLGFCVFFLYELVIGEGDDPARVVMSVVLMGIFALMLLPVAWSMWGAGFWGALPLGLVALAGITAAFASRAEPTDVTL
jgi:hypothetical protein